MLATSSRRAQTTARADVDAAIGPPREGYSVCSAGGGLRAVNRNRRPCLGEQILDRRAKFGGIPSGALVDLRPVGPTLGHPDDAALDLEHPAGDVLGF